LNLRSEMISVQKRGDAKKRASSLDA